MIGKSDETHRSPGDLNLYFDVSGGMAGYAAAGAPNVLGNLVTLSGDFVKSSLYPEGVPGTARFRKFGVYRFDATSPVAPETVADPRSLARPDLYREADTHLADVLRWIAHDQGGGDDARAPLSVVITDLMLDDPQAVDQFEASVGGVLRNLMIERNLAVGILTVRVPFSGKIYFPGASTQVSTSDRPLVMLLIGSPYQVRSFYDYLGTTELRPFSTGTPVSEKQFALFGLEAGTIALAQPNVSGTRSGFVSRQQYSKAPGAERLRAFTYDRGLASASGKGHLQVKLVANADVRDFEVVGNDPKSQGMIWQLDERALDAGSTDVAQLWSRRGSLPLSGWKQTGQQFSYALGPKEMEQAGLDEKGVYLVQILVGQKGIVADHPAVNWMRGWSQSAEQMRARVERDPHARNLGVTGLQSLRNILMGELAIPEQQVIERSASQFLIVVE